MKKLLWFILVIVACVGLHAQNGVMDTGTCPGSGCFAINVGAAGSVGVQFSGTFKGGVLVFEQTVNGTDWVPWQVYSFGSGASTTTTSSAGVFFGNVGIAAKVRVRFVSYAADTVNVTFHLATEAQVIPVATPAPTLPFPRQPCNALVIYNCQR